MKAPTPPAFTDIAQPVYRDARDTFIARVVEQKTFADVGGLWATVRERVSTAHAAGAAALTMLDVTPLDDALWMRFADRLHALGVPEVTVHSADLHAPDLPTFDVVHCSGVLYHSPNPMATVDALRRLTREYLILSCSVVPRVIRNPVGTLAMPDAGWLFLPGLEGKAREIVAAHWRPHVGDLAIGITRPFPGTFDPDDWGPWYWLPTADGLAAMARFVGFHVLDEAAIWGGNAHTLLLRRA